MSASDYTFVFTISAYLIGVLAGFQAGKVTRLNPVNGSKKTR